MRMPFRRLAMGVGVLVVASAGLVPGVSGAQAAPGDRVAYLSDLSPVLSGGNPANGWAKDSTPVGGPVLLEGVTYSKGVGVMSPDNSYVELNYPLADYEGQSLRLVGRVGIADDRDGVPASYRPDAKALVKVDGQLLWSAAQLTKTTSAGVGAGTSVPLDVEIPAGADQLTLVVDSNGRWFNDHVLWADAQLVEDAEPRGATLVRPPYLDVSFPAVGVPVSVLPAVWAPEPSGLAYRWYRGSGQDRAQISGAVSSQYTPTLEDLGEVLSVEVTASAPGLADATAGVQSHPVGEASVIYLSDLDELSWSAYYNAFHKDEFEDAGVYSPLQLAGQVYAKGLFAHAPSTVDYYIEGLTQATLRVVAGLQDTAAGSVAFEVRADGQTIWASNGELNWATGPAVVEVAIPDGTKTLTLYTNQGASTMQDKAIWADAAIQATGAIDAGWLEGKIVNGPVWRDSSGNVIDSHFYGMMWDPKTARWYWYGQSFAGGNLAAGGTCSSWGLQCVAAVGFTVYSSADLLVWDNEGVALPTFNNPQFVDGSPQGDYPLYVAEDSEPYVNSPLSVYDPSVRPPTPPAYQKPSQPWLTKYNDAARIAELNSLYAEYSYTEKKQMFEKFNWNRVAERPHVIYNEKNDNYVMWWHQDGPNAGSYSESMAGVAIADSPAGPFKYLTSARMPNDGYGQAGKEGMLRDMTLFVDTDDVAYLVYSSEDNHSLIVLKLNEDYTAPATNEAGKSVNGEHWVEVGSVDREAPAIFEYGGVYYLVTSGLSGWDPNRAAYLTADRMLGPWTLKGDPCVGADCATTFRSQVTQIMPYRDPDGAVVPGSFIYMADRSNKTLMEDSRYVWVPINLNPDSRTIQIEWAQAWDLKETLNPRHHIELDGVSANVVVGGQLDLSNATAYAVRVSGYREVIPVEEVEIGPLDSSAAGPQEVTLAYGDLTGVFEVVVEGVGPDVDVRVAARCTAGRAQVSVVVKNLEASSGVAVVVDSGYGVKSFPLVGAGKSASQVFTTRLVELPPGLVEVTVGALPDGAPVIWEFGYGRLVCGG